MAEDKSKHLAEKKRTGKSLKKIIDFKFPFWVPILGVIGFFAYMLGNMLFIEPPKLKVSEFHYDKQNWYLKQPRDLKSYIIEMSPGGENGDLELSKYQFEESYSFFFPSLTFQIKNRGGSTCVIDKLLVRVNDSQVDETPVLDFIFYSDPDNNLVFKIKNDGWGPAIDARVTLMSGLLKDYLELKDHDVSWKGSIEDDKYFIVPASVVQKKLFEASKIDWLKKNSDARINYDQNKEVESIEFNGDDFFGEMSYSDNIKKRYYEKFNYQCPCKADEIDLWTSGCCVIKIDRKGFFVTNSCEHNLSVPSAIYNLLLNPDVKRVSQEYLVHRPIEKNETLALTINIGTIKSASYDIDFMVTTDNQKSTRLGNFRIKALRLKNWPLSKYPINSPDFVFNNSVDNIHPSSKLNTFNLFSATNTKIPKERLKEIFVSDNDELKYQACDYIASNPNAEADALFQECCQTHYEIVKKFQFNQCKKRGIRFDLESFANDSMKSKNIEIQKGAISDLINLNSKKLLVLCLQRALSLLKNKAVYWYDFDDLMETLLKFDFTPHERIQVEKFLTAFLERKLKTDFYINEGLFSRIVDFLGDRSVRLLVDLLDSKNETIRCMAAKNLKRIVSNERFVTQFEYLAEDSNPDIRFLFIKDFLKGESITQEEKENIVKDILTHSPSYQIQTEVFQLIGENKLKNLALFLCGILLNKNDSSKGSIIELLGKLQSDDSIPFLRDLYDKEDSYTKRIILNSLCSFSVEKTKDVIVDCLDDEYELSRKAANHLAKNGFKEGFQRIGNFLRNRNERIRLNAIFDIIEFDFSKYRNYVKKELFERDEFVYSDFFGRSGTSGLKVKCLEYCIKNGLVSIREIDSLFKKEKDIGMKRQFAKHLLDSKKRATAFAFLCDLIKKGEYVESDTFENLYSIDRASLLNSIRSMIVNNLRSPYLSNYCLYLAKYRTDDVAELLHEAYKKERILVDPIDFKNHNLSFYVCQKCLETLSIINTESSNFILKQIEKDEDILPLAILLKGLKRNG